MSDAGAARATARRQASWLLALPTFGVYVALAAPGIEWLDAGELTGAAWTLGISHPPGQPLHALCGRAAALLLPFGEIAFRVTVLSALAAALVVPAVVAIARAVIPGASGPSSGEARRASPRADGAAGAYQDATLLVLAVLTAASPLLVEQATRQEVYAPALALLAWGLAFALGDDGAGGTSRGRARASVLLCGLAATLQPIMAAAVVVPVALRLVLVAPRRAPRLVLSLIPIAVLALAPLAYLPLRTLAPRHALLTWGEPGTLARFGEVITGKAYGGNFATAGLAARVGGHALLLGEGVGLGLLAAGLAGLGLGLLTRLSRTGTLAGVFVLTLVLAAGQRVFHASNPDVHGYVLPALLALACGAAVLPAAGARIGAKLGLPAWTGLVVLAPFIGLAGFGARGAHVFVEDGGARRGEGPLALWDATVARMPPGPGLYLADSDHVIFPALYERLVAGARPDLAIAPRPLLTSSWCLRFIDAQRPELAVPFVDDGGRADAIETRLIVDNGRAGRPLAAELPGALGPAALPVGRAYALGLPRETTTPRPPAYPGGFGGRVSRHVALVRGRWELSHGDRTTAARALGLDDAAPTDTTPAPTPARRPLAHRLPALPDRPIFVSEAWQVEAARRDLRWLAGELPAPTPDDGPELRLLASWQLVLSAPSGPRGAIASTFAEALARGEPGVLATAIVLAEAGRIADAEELLEAFLVRTPAATRARDLLSALRGRPPG